MPRPRPPSLPPVVVVVVALAVASGPVAAAGEPRVPRRAVVAAPVGRPPVADPAPPTAAELAGFHGVVQDDDVLKIPPCRRAGLATTDCRDPMSYLTSNEALQSVWQPWIENLGGGYVGLGSDQNYSLIAAARSQWAWLFDYDPQVVRVHRIIQILVGENESADDFIAAFDRKSAPLTRERLKERLTGDPEAAEIVGLFDFARGRLHSHFVGRRYSTASFGWLNDADRYRYIRRLVLQGRIQALKGNMLTDKSLPGIAASARAVGVPIRVYYPSNAEEMWKFTPQYRANVVGFPFDEQSVVLRTLFNKAGPWDDQHRYWHYVVHRGVVAQRTIADDKVTSTRVMMRDRRPTNEPILSAIGFD